MGKTKTSKEDLLHVKFEYEEASQAKKNVLYSQMALLKIAKIIRDYNFYRNKELELKTSLSIEIKDLKMVIGKLHKMLPKPERPEILKKEKVTIREPEIKTKKKIEYSTDIEKQLMDIEDRLRSLQ